MHALLILFSSSHSTLMTPTLMEWFASLGFGELLCRELQMAISTNEWAPGALLIALQSCYFLLFATLALHSLIATT